MLSQLEKLLYNEDRQLSIRRLLRRIFLEDRMIKVIALFITFALWYGVTGLRAPTTARLRNVALNMRLSNDMEVTNSPVQEVDLVVTGDKRRIETINPRDLLVSLDLTEVSAGDNTIQILPENVSRSVELPTGVRLEEVQPNKIAVRLEKVQEREIEVKIETEGSVAENFEVYNQTVVPQRVRVRGPESFVNSLDFVSTERINLNNQRANFTVRQVPVNIVNPKVTVLDAVVDVVFRVGERRIERLFVVTFPTENGNRTATVVLFGGRSVVEALTPHELNVQLFKNEAGEDSLRLNLQPEIQESVEIRRLKIN